MGTIKFRAKNLDGEWVYGFYVEEDRQTLNGFEKKYLIVNDDGHHYVKPETVGQFTGLHDNDGKEIYEGDIMNNPTSKNVGVVKWNSVLCQFQLSWQNMPTAADIFFMVESGSFVIGNIHDNPELLKGGEQ